MRLSLCVAPTRETRPDHNTGNCVPYYFQPIRLHVVHVLRPSLCESLRHKATNDVSPIQQNPNLYT